MKKAVIISIHPKWCQMIASGEKTIEVRKNRPKLDTPFKCYIYCTRDKHLAFMQNQTGTNLIACMDVETAIPVGGSVGTGKIIGEFTCDRIDWITHVGYMGAPNSVETCVCDAATMRMSPVGELLNATRLTPEMLNDYLAGRYGYGWHINGLRIYDTPRELGEFTGLRDTRFGAEPYDIKRPPQSWCYVDGGKEGWAV